MSENEKYTAIALERARLRIYGLEDEIVQLLIELDRLRSENGVAKAEFQCVKKVSQEINSENEELQAKLAHMKALNAVLSEARIQFNHIWDADQICTKCGFDNKTRKPGDFPPCAEPAKNREHEWNENGTCENCGFDSLQYIGELPPYCLEK